MQQGRALLLKLGDQLDLIPVLGNSLFKGVAFCTFQCACDGKFDRQWINGFIVDAEFIVQVRTCSPSGGTYVANKIPLADLGPFFQTLGETALVSVKRGVFAMVFQDDGFAVAALGADKFDRTVGGGMN